VALYLVLAVSLAMGMRLAHSWLWNESASTDG
jgi:hypothetical protein